MHFSGTTGKNMSRCNDKANLYRDHVDILPGRERILLLHTQVALEPGICHTSNVDWDDCDRNLFEYLQAMRTSVHFE